MSRVTIRERSYEETLKYLQNLMSKSEVHNKLKETGLVSKFQRDSGGLWEQAFKLYNEAHPRDQKRASCGSCFRAVLNWLQS